MGRESEIPTPKQQSVECSILILAVPLIPLILFISKCDFMSKKVSRWKLFMGATAESLTHPHRDGVNDLHSHTVLCPSRHLTFFVFPIFILSHPAWDRIKSSRYYTEMCLCLPDMFSLSGPTVITFPGFQTSTHKNGKPPARMCWPYPLDVLLFQNFYATYSFISFNIPK